MGKQVEFYMTPGDELAFLEALRARRQVGLLYCTSKGGSSIYVESLRSPAEDPYAANLALYCPGMEPRISYETVQPGSVQVLDLTDSEVVQFNRSSLREGWLQNGRFWFEVRAREGPKSEEFQKWANALLRWITRHYERDASGRYAGPGALTESRAGTLKLGPPLEGISLEERKRILGLS